MAKLTDKFYNRVIEGPFEPDSADEAKIIKGLEGQDVKVKKLETTSDVKIGGKLDVTGDAKLFENIVDKDGHKRFIEGDVTLNEIEGLTQTYGKWSLSGSHLLIVIAGSIDNGTALSGTIGSVDLPAWVKDKLVTIYGQAVIRQTDNVYSSDGSTNQSVINVLGKSGANIYIGSYITANADRYFRYQFDLLIDNE